MPRILTLALALLCSAAWLQAQSQYPQNSPSSSTPSTSQSTGSSQTGQMGSTSSQMGTSAGQTMVEGCLQGSSGNFTLTDTAGTTYQLSGDTSKLTKHVGHEVEITGSTSGSSAASSSGSSMSQGGSQKTLTVSKVKHVSDTCKASKQ